jgi:hypothetical protein
MDGKETKRVTETPEDTPRQPDGTVLEALPALARFAYDWAPTLCNPDHGCTHYHRIWSMVRLLESDGALPEGTAFFDAEIPKVARDGVARIILSGGADTGLMTLAINACGRAGITPDITMIDRCATPLQQCSLFARQIGVSFLPIQGTLDTLDVAPADAILAHSFMPFLPRELWGDLFASWSRNLRRGGKVLMSQRLVAPGRTYVKDINPEILNARAQRLKDAFLRAQPIGVSADEIVATAQHLWMHPLSGRGVSEQDIRDLCAASDLSVEAMSVDADQQSVSPSVACLRSEVRFRTGIVLVKQG